MSFILFMIVGAAAGFLATRLMHIDASVPSTIAIGMGGALIGGVFILFLLDIAGWIAGFAGAVGGSLTLLWVWKTFIAGR